jgi:hypothetical protein
MTPSGLREDVDRLLRVHIHSVEQMEVLLLLRAHPSRDWTGAQAAQELRIDPDSAGGRLSDLHARGFLAPGAPGAFRYAPEHPDVARAVEGLAAAYAERRVTVINLIFSKPSERISSFADAFRLRRGR